MDIFDYASGIPRRIERQLRASWTLTPALRNLYFRRALLETASIAYNFDCNDFPLLEEHGKEMCGAAAELYHHLQNGYYKLSNGQKRAIGGDIAKLRFAKDLSPKAKLLERNLRHHGSFFS